MNSSEACAWVRHARSSLAPIAALCAVGTGAGAADDRFILIERDLTARSITVLELDHRAASIMNDSGVTESLPLDQCLLLLREAPLPAVEPRGKLILADGAHVPGTSVGCFAEPVDHVAWSHAWLGVIDVPLDRLRTMIILPGATPEEGSSDTLRLRDGEKLEGFVLGIGRQVDFETRVQNESRHVRVDLDRVESISFVARPRPRVGRWAWFGDGTALEVRALTFGSDGWVHLDGSWATPSANAVQVGDLAGLAFAAERVVPLAQLRHAPLPAEPMRWRVPSPRLVTDGEPFGVETIELRGPLQVTYPMPDGATRFAAEFELAPGSEQWGDLDLRIGAGTKELSRAHLDASNPVCTVNVPIDGASLEITLTAGAHAAIQDRVLVRRGMVLVGE